MRLIGMKTSLRLSSLAIALSLATLATGARAQAPGNTQAAPAAGAGAETPPVSAPTQPGAPTAPAPATPTAAQPAAPAPASPAGTPPTAVPPSPTTPAQAPAAPAAGSPDQSAQPTLPAEPAPVAPPTAPPSAAAPAPAAPADVDAPRITSAPPEAAERSASRSGRPSIEEQEEWAPGAAPKLYVRLGLGIAFPFGSDVADVYADRNQEELSFSGAAVAQDWMAGIALMPSLVLGLGVTMDMLTSGVIRNADDAKRDLDNSLYFAVIGGFVDYYYSPPAGVHLQALLGLSHLSRADNLSRNTGNGFGAVLGVGYDFAVGRRWNMGVLGRVAFSSLSMDAVGDEEPSPTLYEPSLLWTFTFRPEA